MGHQPDQIAGLFCLCDLLQRFKIASLFRICDLWHQLHRGVHVCDACAHVKVHMCLSGCVRSLDGAVDNVADPMHGAGRLCPIRLKMEDL